MTIGERMKERRKELGISAEALAEIIKVAPATIYRYENGDILKVPSPILAKIADALNTSFGYLMGWTNIPDKYTADQVRDIIMSHSKQDQERLDKFNKLTPENQIRFDAFLEGLLAGQEKPSD